MTIDTINSDGEPTRSDQLDIDALRLGDAHPDEGPDDDHGPSPVIFHRGGRIGRSYVRGSVIA